MRTIETNMTVGYLKKFLEEFNIPDDAVIFTERVEDNYYKPGKGWQENSVFKEGEVYNDMKEYKDACYLMQEVNITDEELESFKTQYTAIWSPVKYDDDDNLYLNLHY